MTQQTPASPPQIAPLPARPRRFLRLGGGLLLAAALLLAGLTTARLLAGGHDQAPVAGPLPASRTPAAAAGSEGARLSGRVLAFDGSSLTLDAGAGPSALLVDSRTRIQLWNGLVGNARDLARGVNVVVDAAGDPAGGLYARSIQVRQPD